MGNYVTSVEACAAFAVKDFDGYCLLSEKTGGRYRERADSGFFDFTLANLRLPLSMAC